MFIPAIIIALLVGCADLPEKSPTKLEKSPCACGQAADTSRNV